MKQQHTVSLFLTLDQLSFLQTAVSEKIQRLISQGAAMEVGTPEWLHQEYLSTCNLARQLSEKKAEMERAEHEKGECRTKWIAGYDRWAEMNSDS